MINLSFTEFCDQGLIQKQKVDINGENGAQINIAAINNVTQGLAQILIMESKQAVSYISFSFFLLLSSYYVINTTKKIDFSLNLGVTKLVCPKSVYWSSKQPVSNAGDFKLLGLCTVENCSFQWIKKMGKIQKDMLRLN